MAHVNKVIRSINEAGESRCVDVFRRPDGSFGFEEFRRDIEDARGWFAVGVYSAKVFSDEESAFAAARRAVAWLATRADH
jgi:hypothetical protein